MDIMQEKPGCILVAISESMEFVHMSFIVHELYCAVKFVSLQNHSVLWSASFHPFP